MAFLKLTDPEWYYRKFMRYGAPLLADERVRRIKLLHDVRRCYRATFGKAISFLSPKTLNEKLIWLSLFWTHPDKVRCADKFKMREYCLKKGLPEDVLVPLIATYSSADEIDFSALPDRFVLKCNHGCGYNIIVNDKPRLDIATSIASLSSWLLECYRGGVSEVHYADIQPRIIMCEEYLPSLDSGSIVDYKIHCINGQPVFVLVCYDRDDDGVAKLATFDFGWRQLFYCKGECAVNAYKPESLDRMIEYSRILSKEFPFLRADFYDVGGHPYLGEMTFTPYGNMIDYFTDEVQVKYGRMLRLPHKYK